MEVAPGRGKPRVRFRRKLPGMVPNEQMKNLINAARLRPNFGDNNDLNDDERASKRRRCIAELQQKWRPLGPDGFRLVALLLSCSRDGNFMGIDLNNAFVEALIREDLYRRTTQGSRAEMVALCKSLGLRVSDPRKPEDLRRDA